MSNSVAKWWVLAHLSGILTLSLLGCDFGSPRNDQELSGNAVSVDGNRVHTPKSSAEGDEPNGSTGMGISAGTTHAETNDLSEESVPTLADREPETEEFSAETSRVTYSQLIAHVPDGALIRFGRGGIQTLSVSPRRNHVAIGGHLGAYLYDLDTLEEEWSYPTPGWVSGIAYSPDGSMIAISWGLFSTTGQPEPATDIIDAVSGQLLVSIKHQEEEVGEYVSVSWSPDGQKLVLAFEHAPSEIRDVSGNLITTLESTVFGSSSVSWSPDGSKIAAIEGRVYVWDSTSGALLETLSRYNTLSEEGVNNIAWSPDGTILAVGTDQELSLFETATWKVTSSLGPVSMEINGAWETRTDDNWGLAFSPDQTTIAASGMDGRIILWNIETGEVSKIIDSGKRGAGDIAWSPDTNNIVFASRDNSLLVIDPATGLIVQMIDGHIGPAYRLAWSPDEQKLATGGVITISKNLNAPMGGEIAVWDVRSGQLLKKIPDRGYGIAWSPDGTRLATGAPPLTIHDTSSIEPITIIGGAPSSELYISYRFTSYGDLEWSSSGKYLLQAQQGRLPSEGPILWDYNRGTQINSDFVAYSEEIDHLKLSPDEKYIAASVDGVTTSILTIPSGKEVVQLWHGKKVQSTGWLNGSNQIALWSGSDIQIWDIPSGNLASSIDISNYYSSGVFSPDGKRIAMINAYSGRSLDVLDVQNGTLLETFPVDGTLPYQSVSWSPTGKYLASTLPDGTVVVWETSYGDVVSVGPSQVQENGNLENNTSPPDIENAASGEESDNITAEAPSSEPDASQSTYGRFSADYPTLGSILQRTKDQKTMVYVPAGLFEMGSTVSEVELAVETCLQTSNTCNRGWFEDELPKHAVYMDDFWIDQTEVTNAQFAIFLNSQGNQIEGTIPWYAIDNPDSKIKLDNAGTYQVEDGYSNHPVTLVTWYAANAYCIWAGGVLPTEAQWEYAARGQENAIYPWGNHIDGANMNYCDSNCYLDGADLSVSDNYAETAPTKSYANNLSWVGAYDMAGNVWEWTSDWYDETYYSHSPSQNPQGPDSGTTKVLRGGSWRSPKHYTRTTVRNSITRRSHYRNDYGFRCVR